MMPAIYWDGMAPIIKLDSNGASNLTMMQWAFRHSEGWSKAGDECSQPGPMLHNIGITGVVKAALAN